MLRCLALNKNFQPKNEVRANFCLSACVPVPRFECVRSGECYGYCDGYGYRGRRRSRRGTICSSARPSSSGSATWDAHRVRGFYNPPRHGLEGCEQFFDSAARIYRYHKKQDCRFAAYQCFPHATTADRVELEHLRSELMPPFYGQFRAMENLAECFRPLLAQSLPCPG